jgi:hypothetical protein
MKPLFKESVIVILLFWTAIYFPSCMKEADLPSVVTDDVTDIKAISATFNGEVSNDGGAKVDLEGFCFGTAHNPTLENSTIQYIKGDPRSFTKIVPFLVPDTYYHVRAFAINSEGTAYGNEVHFRTKPVFLASLVPIGPYQVTIFSATAGAYISDDGGTPLLEKGVCLSTRANPTINDMKVPQNTGAGDDAQFICNISDLEPETLYHLRPYAITMGGVAYGDEREFKTYPLPLVTTNVVTDYTQTTARVDGVLSWSGPERFVRQTGICYGTTSAPTFTGGFPFELAPSNNGREFSETLEDLTPGTLYYVRAFATVVKDSHYDNADDQFVLYGNEITFTTSK